MNNFMNVFLNLDGEGRHNLSQARYKRDMKRWASNDPFLNWQHLSFHEWGAIDVFELPYSPPLCCWDCSNIPKEAYIVCGLLSYARKYWRKAVERNTQTSVALQLRALLKPNPAKAREGCRKEKKKQTKGGGSYPFPWGWELCVCVHCLDARIQS